MSKARRLLDTNLIVRHLVQDNARQAEIALRIFNACDRGDLTLVILPAVLAECVFVLESFYEHDRADIAAVLTGLVTSPGVEFSDRQSHVDALRLYAKSKLHFVDCMLAATAAARGLPVATFDSGFKKLPGVRVELT